MPALSIVVHFNDRQEPRLELVLALQRMRRGVERHTARGHAPGSATVAMSNPELTRALLELIEALDRRVPHVERAGESSIARDAAALRDKARRRLSELDEDGAAAPADPRR